MSDAPASSPMTRPNHVVSQRTQTFGMIIFLVALGILFASTMLVYVLVRLVFGTEQPPIGYMRDELANPLLFASTAVVLAASVTVHLAVSAIRHEKRPAFLRWLFITDFLAALFVAIQIPAMITLLTQHVGSSVDEFGNLMASRDRFFGVIMFLILLHAAHVAGGIIYLLMVTLKALRGGYDHESHRGVWHAALYWHFLDVVWLVMYGTLLILG